MKDGQYSAVGLYVAGSVALGMLAVAAGYALPSMLPSLAKAISSVASRIF